MDIIIPGMIQNLEYEAIQIMKLSNILGFLCEEVDINLWF